MVTHAGVIGAAKAAVGQPEVAPVAQNLAAVQGAGGGRPIWAGADVESPAHVIWLARWPVFLLRRGRPSGAATAAAALAGTLAVSGRPGPRPPDGLPGDQVSGGPGGPDAA